MREFVAAIALSLAALSFGAAPQTLAEKGLALVGGTLLDGRGGVVPDSVILVRGERIEQVGTGSTLSVPAGYEQISTEGLTVVPGLWDPHVHLMYGGHPSTDAWFKKYVPDFEKVVMPATAEQFLRAGITTVRDLIAPTDAVLSVRRRVASGALTGPRIFASGNALSKAGPNAPALARIDITNIADEADARLQVRKLLNAGVDVIKVINAANWTVAELEAVVAEAHARNVKVTSHARSDEDLRRNLEARVDEMQHIGATGAEYGPELVALIRERVTNGPPLYWSPTASPVFDASYIDTTPEYLDDIRNYRGMPSALSRDIRTAIAARRASARGGREAQTRQNQQAFLRKFRQLQQLGVDFVFGSDEGTFGLTPTDATWREAQVWVEGLGIEPMVVVREMTFDAARMMGVDKDYGELAQGKFADIVGVRGDPLRSMTALRQPELVLKHGRRVIDRQR